MVDETIPTSQFHPYQPVTSTPAAERPQGGLSNVLNKVGIDPTSGRSIADQMKNIRTNDTLTKCRNYAKANPGKVLGGLAAVAIGLGLWRSRRA